VDYLRPVDYGHPVTIEWWVEEIRASRFVIAYELRDEGELAGRARSVLVPFDLAASRPRRLTEGERAFLSAWTDGREP
jgi:acyl-CoA thioester hydrolase